jgi:hypothetical protein
VVITKVTFFFLLSFSKNTCGQDKQQSKESPDPAALFTKNLTTKIKNLSLPYTQVSTAMPRKRMKVRSHVFVLSIAHSEMHESRIV